MWCRRALSARAALLLCVAAAAAAALRPASALPDAGSKVVMCYYGTWATYRPPGGRFDVEHIEAALCTHLVYTFVGIAEDGSVRFLDPYLDLPDNWGRDNFGKFNALKKQNPGLKTILAVGGWNEGSAKYSVMANSLALRKVFVQSATDTLLRYGFDGLDMDWEYPNRRDSVHGQLDVDNFSQLLRDLREAFDKHGLLLTAAVASVEEMARLSYDIPTISKSLDLISVMAYDLEGPWNSFTGHNAPLHRGIGDEAVPREQAYTVDVAVEYWLQQGCPREKLLVGMPLYGHTYTLRDAGESGVRAPAAGPGLAGPYTRQSGGIGYNEFCDMIKTEAWDLRYDDHAKVPYAVKDRDWVSYDDAASLELKTKFAAEQRVGGVMVWSIETDDFHGLCHNETNHLLRTINRALSRHVEPAETSSTSASTTPVTTTTTTTEWTTSSSTSPATSPPSTPASYDVCKEEGYTPDPEDCSSFYYCLRTEDGRLVPNHFTCPAGLVWDQSALLCNYRELVECTL